jgi:DNA-binding SARP family transcriptional activator
VTSEPGALRCLLLGGFEVWSGGQLVRGFESQKVRALLAFLLLHRGRAVGRDRLAGLFWGDRDGESARRNLRQAIYNLKSTLPSEASARRRLAIDAHELRFDLGAGDWLDVEVFERAAGEPAGGGRPRFHDLVAAAQLYRGDLLAGLLLDGCLEFEEWLLAAQERLRETALETLRRIVAACAGRGEYLLAIRHARRLLAMDPLSEAAHRDLMRLYELAGQRGRALAHYAELTDLLRRELGIEPLPETRALRQAILADALADEGAREPAGAAGPIVPLVGRAEPYERLAECWQAVLDGNFRATLVYGEEGIGKSRLVRSFLGAACARRRTTVLIAACDDRLPSASYRPLVEALRQALPDEPGASPDPRGALSAATRRRLALLLPELAAGATPGPPDPADAAPAALAAATAELLALATRTGSEPSDRDPLVIFLDDLQWADPATLALLAALPEHAPAAPVWILGACDPDRLPADHPCFAFAARDGDGTVTTIALERLAAAALDEVASALVEPGDAPAFAELLDAASEGLPLALVTLVNSGWDEGDLALEEDGHWRLGGDLARWRERAERGLDAALVARVRRLPTSTRRLAALAAVVGRRFESELLEAAEHEHASVVETALGLLVERWLVRQHRERWHPVARERNVGLWRRGARTGRFEFDHPRVARALYDDLNPLRRQVLHRQVADALARLHRERTPERTAELARHALEGGLWERAFDALLELSEHALAAGDAAGAALARERAQRALDRLRREAGSEEELRRVGERERALEAVAGAAGR